MHFEQIGFYQDPLPLCWAEIGFVCDFLVVFSILRGSCITTYIINVLLQKKPAYDKNITLSLIFGGIWYILLAKYQNCHFWKLKEELKRTEKNLKELKLSKYSCLRHIKKLKRTNKNWKELHKFSVLIASL